MILFTFVTQVGQPIIRVTDPTILTTLGFGVTVRYMVWTYTWEISISTLIKKFNPNLEKSLFSYDTISFFILFFSSYKTQRRLTLRVDPVITVNPDLLRNVTTEGGHEASYKSS